MYPAIVSLQSPSVHFPCALIEENLECNRSDIAAADEHRVAGY